METGIVLQVLSSFTANLIQPSIEHALADSGIAAGVGFTPKTHMSEYMLAPSSDTEHILGTLVLLRVEDWLREGMGTGSDLWPREELKTRVREFVSELTILSYRGKPVWFLACPSTGWISEKYNLASLCRTYTNLLVARVRNVSQVNTLTWPAALLADAFDDRKSDELDKTPFTQDAFDRLGEFLGGEIARTLASDSSTTHAAAGGSPELAAYLAGLQVQVLLSPAGRAARTHVDRVLRTAASFSLTGEKPNISQEEVDALLDSQSCTVVSVADRLGDHGPSGVVVYRRSKNALVVQAMALSCTVLGKQVEHALLSALARMAAERDCSELVFEYRSSGRNQPMLSFLQSIADASNDQYVLPLDQADVRINATAVNPGAWSIRVGGLEKAFSEGH